MQLNSKFTVFENHRKSLIQHCERRELRLQVNFNRTNFGEKCQNGKTQMRHFG